MTFPNDGKEKMNLNYHFNYPDVAYQAGFQLRQFKEGELNWRLIGNVEVERILRDQNVEQLDKVLQHLAEAPLAGILESHILDSGIAKYFMLSQFALQYLLFCRNFLDESLAEIRHVYGDSQREVAMLRQSLSEANREILQLHKKITQIEAIREIIYPCHLCTKNFVSNESLNLHLSRKHAKWWNKTNAQSSSHTTTASQTVNTVSVASTRDNDIELIKTIKLELEIKQLKERLNIAEKALRQRNRKQDSSSSQIPGEELIVMSKPKLHCIAIQCNLAETKEQNVNQSVPTESETSGQETEIEFESGTSNDKLRQDHEHLSALEDKVRDFEEWRATQTATNQQNIQDINDKLKEITSALDYVKNLKVTNTATPSLDTNAIEILERQLTQKITEIGLISSEKIDHIIFNMEETYNKKLKHFEDEIKHGHFQSTRNAQNTKIPRPVRRQRTDELPKTSGQEVQNESLSESNRTFIKSTSLQDQSTKDRAEEILKNVDDGATDVSEALESGSEVTASDDDDEGSSLSDSSSSLELKSKSKAQATKLKILNKKPTTKPLKKPAEPKLVTRKDIKRMSNHRLSEFDCSLSQKTLSAGSMKKITQKLNEKRIQDKQIYPTFYATRNRWKKYVDRICSKKPDTNVEMMLKESLPVQPPKPPRKILPSVTKFDQEPTRNEAVKHTLDDSRISQPSGTSTPKISSDQSQGDFRERLERILASPIHKPIQHIGDADNNAQEMDVKPLPMPRKRVMFNTRDSAAEAI